MANRMDILTAKVEMIAEVVADGNQLKDSATVTVSESRQAQSEAVMEVIEAGGSVNNVKSVRKPSERVNDGS